MSVFNRWRSMATPSPGTPPLSQGEHLSVLFPAINNSKQLKFKLIKFLYLSVKHRVVRLTKSCTKHAQATTARDEDRRQQRCATQNINRHVLTIDHQQVNWTNTIHLTTLIKDHR
jgi:hypothetical protein